MTAAFVLNATVTKADNKDYKLVWSDEFDGDQLDYNNWGKQTGGTGWGNNEWQTYTDSDDNLEVKDGLLNINILADKSSSKTKFTSARINSSGKVAMKYGRIEARIKVPGDRGMWPAFWMLGADEPRGWPYCGEIDILETWNSYSFAQGTLHFENEIYKPNRDTYITGQTKLADKTQWHIYGMIWNAKQVSFYVDDTIYSTMDVTPSYMSEIRNNYYYFLINCAAGGNLPVVGPTDDFESSKLLVDYVRVYQNPADNGGAKYVSNDIDLVNSYTVKFLDGPNVISTSKLKEGEFSAVPKLAKTKYIFKKWMRLEDKDTIDENSRIYKDSTISAIWEKIKLKKAQITKLKSTKKRCVSIKYKAKGNYDGFEVKIGSKSKKTKTGKVTIKKLKSKKKYKVKVRTYQKDSLNKTFYGKWSKTKKIKVK